MQGICKGRTYISSHGLVDRSPPNILLRRLFLDNALIRRRAASFRAGVCTQGTAGGDGSTSFIDEGIFVKSRDRGVGDLDRVRHGTRRIEQSTYNSDTLVVDMRGLVKLLLEFSVALAGSAGRSAGFNTVARRQEYKGETHWTPPGCRAVRFTEVATIFLREVE